MWLLVNKSFNKYNRFLYFLRKSAKSETVPSELLAWLPRVFGSPVYYRFGNLLFSGCTHAYGFYRFCRAIEWNLEACSPLWLHIWIQMCLSQVVNFLTTRPCSSKKKRQQEKISSPNFAPLWVLLPGGTLINWHKFVLVEGVNFNLNIFSLQRQKDFA